MNDGEEVRVLSTALDAAGTCGSEDDLDKADVGVGATGESDIGEEDLLTRTALVKNNVRETGTGDGCGKGRGRGDATGLDLGLAALLDRDDKKVAAHPASFNSIESYLMEYFIENPWLLKAPIVRNGSKVTIGYQPDVWEQWMKEG